MKIPKHVTIGGIKHTVKRKITPHTSTDVCYGKYSESKSSITITSSRNVGKEKKLRTFIHEVLHGINEDRNIGLEENQIDCMSGGLYESMKSCKLNFSE
jgi:hypothetical protein